MEENPTSSVSDGKIIGIRFGLATSQEIRIASNSEFAIGHASQLTNPFLGLPLVSGKCESCGTAEPGQCDGHFGFIELPTPIYHPSHVSELRRMLSLLCLKCLRLKKNRFLVKTKGVSNNVLNPRASCCEDLCQISIKEGKTTDGSYYLELKLPSRSKPRSGFWNFLERYGFRYGESLSRPLLPSEVMEMLKKIPAETRRKLAAKGYFPQDGYVFQFLPVPPNCLSIPDISDGINVMSSDLSVSLLKKVLKQVEIIKSSRSGMPNFESQEVEANDLQSAVSQYLDARGTSKAARDVERFGVSKESNDTSTKAWLEKMRTLFIRKGSGFSSRSVITGDAYNGVNEIGIPFEIARKITFEEKVNVHNMKYLQKLVDDKLCLTYRDGLSTYSLREGSKGHTLLKPGQIVHRRIMDGDMVFVNRPPTTHKHSLQALSVYLHEDHTVKINPLICGPLGADFDGDCVHLFYPQSPAAKAEALELFLVDKQLISSHTGSFNLQIATDSLLSLKNMFKIFFLAKAAVQQLAMFVSTPLAPPAVLKGCCSAPSWTALQILQTALPASVDCCGEKYLIKKSELLKVDLDKDGMQKLINEIVTSILFEKGPKEVLDFFNSLQPLLMEFIASEGFSIGLEDFSTPSVVLQKIRADVQDIYPLLYHLRRSYNELVELQLENHIRQMKAPIVNFILKSSALGSLIDSKSDSALNKVIQQIGFLGSQLSDRGNFYTRTLVEDMASLFRARCPFDKVEYPSGEYGLIRSCFFHGLNPFEEMVHSISSREVLVRSSKGLSEPGTLFKNLMAILRDVVICYDGTVRNVSSDSIIQFKYGSESLFPAGEPVGVLAATAMSNPAYKAVLDSSPSSNSCWELMKEILLPRVNFKNDVVDRRVILYLNDCGCGRQHCQENAAYLVKNKLQKVSLKDTAIEFMIEYNTLQTVPECCSESDAGLIGHIHLNQNLLTEMNINMLEILEKCQENINSYRKKKKSASLLKRTVLSASECCSFRQSCKSKWSGLPCLRFLLQDVTDSHLERISGILSDVICPVLLETIIKGDPRIFTVDIIWISPDSATWVRHPGMTCKGELALDVVLDKAVVKQSGDPWRVIMDSCIPFIHLIDTRRSIPYAIKQIQELLGISCAFDQAVQRLSTSVGMVAKGVRKEHLVLLANSMTAGGNLVGFNVGGYKALSRSLDIQAPFTEATLFTPRKCFERSAEKCHVDSLSSVVASCSWGKHVAVGTGSRFDILWDEKEVGVKQEGGVDVYSFLHLVRGGSGGGSNTDCLGAEVDELMSDDENFDIPISPMHDVEKPRFEETLELQSDEPESSTWDFPKSNQFEGHSSWDQWRDSTAKEDSCQTSRNWDQGFKNSNELSPWGQKKESTAAQDRIESPNGWGQVVKSKGQSQWGQQNETVATEDRNEIPCTRDQSWSGNKVKPLWNKQRESAPKKDETESTNNWDRGWNETGAQPQWGQQREPTEKKDLNVSPKNWERESTPKKDESESTHNWDQGWKKTGGQPQWGQQSEPTKKDHNASPRNWERESTPKKEDSESPHNWDQGWSKSGAQPQWGQQREPSGKKDHNVSAKNWDQPFSTTEGQAGWGKQRETTGSNNRSQSPRNFDQGLNRNEFQSQWDQQRKSTGRKDHDESSNNDGGWIKNQGPGEWDQPQESTEKKDPTENSHNGDRDADENGGQFGWGQEREASTKKNQSENSHNWGTPNETPNELNQLENLHGLGSPFAGGGNESQMTSQWGQQPFKKNRPETSRGWSASNAGEWKNKNRPARSPRISNDDTSATGIFTATRQRLDMFTSEEQEILSDVEPVVLSIRKIMQQLRYNDGDPLSADDQSYILENVFSYHPDKAVKMGAGIDYVTINKHGTFQDSRCLFIVTTDGHKEDFSYRKCLSNFIRGKYPDLADTFIDKYFKKPNPRPPGGTREPLPSQGENLGEKKP